MENRIYQIQRMLADELDIYKGRGNKYIEDNIKEIQELYKIKEDKRNQRVIEEDKVILIKPYHHHQQQQPNPVLLTTRLKI